MTSKELSQLYYLNKEIKLYQQRIKKLRDKATNASASITGAPKSNSTKDIVGECASDIAQLWNLIEDNRKEAITAEINIQKYINSIEDSLTRLIFYYRYIECLPWHSVAYKIGGNNTADSVRKAHERFLTK